MKHTRKFLALALAFCLLLGACGQKEGENEQGDESASGGSVTDFDYSGQIDEDGMWKGVKALDLVQLPDYSKITVAQADIDSEIETFLNSYPDMEKIMDREIADGDYVNIDYVGTIGGVEFEGGSTQGNGTMVIIGYTSYIDDFIDQLIGHKPGETFDINVTFPDDYGDENLNGRDAVFETTVNYIAEYHKAELTDEFVQTNLAASYGWTTVDDMTAGIAAECATRYLYDNTTFQEVPESMVDYNIEAAIAYYKAYASAYGITFEEFLQSYTEAGSEAEFREAQYDSAYDSATYYLLYQALEEDMGLSVSDKDVTAYFSNLGTTDLDTMVDTYGMPYLKNQLLINEVIEELQSRIEISEDAALDTPEETPEETPSEPGEAEAE